MQPPQIAPFSRLCDTWSFFLQCSLQCTMRVAVCSAVHTTHYTIHNTQYTIHNTLNQVHTTTVHVVQLYRPPTEPFLPNVFINFRFFEANPPHQKLAVLAAVALLFVKPCMVSFFANFLFSLHTAFVTTDFVSWWQKLKIDQTQRCTNTQTKGTVQHCTMLYTGQH